MFGLHKYLDKIFKIKWYFDPTEKQTLESQLFVTFRQQKDHFLIETIHYSFIDILLALEAMDFELTKKSNEYKIKISKI